MSAAKRYIIDEKNKLQKNDIEALQKIEVTREFVDKVAVIKDSDKRQIIDATNSAEQEILKIANNRKSYNNDVLNKNGMFNIQLQDKSDEKIGDIVNKVTSQISTYFTSKEIIIESPPIYIERGQQENEKLKRENIKLAAKLSIARDEVGAIKLTLLEVSSKFKTAIAERNNAIRERDKILAKLKTITQRLGIPDGTNIFAGISNINKYKRQLEQEKKQLEQDKVSLTNQIQLLNQEKLNLESNINILQQQINQLNTNIQQVINEKTQVEQKMTNMQLQHVQDMQDFKTRYTEKARNVIKNIKDDHQKKYNKLQLELLEERKNQVIVTRLTGENNSLKQQLSQLQNSKNEELKNAEEKYLLLQSNILQRNGILNEAAHLQLLEQHKREIQKITNSYEEKIRLLDKTIKERDDDILKKNTEIKEKEKQMEEQKKQMEAQFQNDMKEYVKTLEEKYVQEVSQLTDRHNEEKKLLQNDIENRQQEIDKQKQDILRLEREAKNAHQQITEQQDKIDELQNQYIQNNNNIINITNENEEIDENAIREMEQNIINNESKYNDLVLQINKHKQEIVDLNNQLATSQQLLSEEKNKNSELIKAIEMLRRELPIAKTKRKRFEEDMQQLEAKLQHDSEEKDKEIMNIQNYITALQNELKDISDELQESRKFNEEEMEEYKEQIKILSEQNRELKLMQENINRDYVLRSEVEKINEQVNEEFQQLTDRHAQELEMKDKEMQVLNQQINNIKEILDKYQKTGPSVISIEKYNELNQLYESIVEKSKLAETSYTKLKSENQEMARELEEYYNSKSQIDSVQRRANNRSRNEEEYKQKISELQNELNNASDQIERLNTAIYAFGDVKVNTEDKIEVAQSVIKDKILQIDKLKDKIDVLTKEKLQIQNEMNEIKTQSINIQAALADLEGKLNSIAMSDNASNSIYIFENSIQKIHDILQKIAYTEKIVQDSDNPIPYYRQLVQDIENMFDITREKLIEKYVEDSHEESNGSLTEEQLLQIEKEYQKELNDIDAESDSNSVYENVTEDNQEIIDKNSLETQTTSPQQTQQNNEGGVLISQPSEGMLNDTRNFIQNSANMVTAVVTGGNGKSNLSKRKKNKRAPKAILNGPTDKSSIIGGDETDSLGLFASFCWFGLGGLIIFIMILVVFYLAHQIYQNQIKSKDEMIYNIYKNPYYNVILG